MSKYYDDKRHDSFKTKYKLFLFKMAFEGETPKKLVKKKDIIDVFSNFKINDTIIKAYASSYYQKKYDETVEYNSRKLTVDDIWHCMDFEKNNLFQLTEYRHRKNISDKYVEFYNELKESYKNIFGKLFSINDFNKMIENKVCSYCGVSEDDISELGKQGELNNKRSETRGYTLEIDRKEANGEYTEKNCCMSCYWCNNAKTDEFSVVEFKDIAKGINSVWEKRLGKAIEFPTKVYSECKGK